MLRIAAVAAHVPLSGGTGRTGFRVGAPDNANNKIPYAQPHVSGSLKNAAQVLMAQDQEGSALRRLPVFPGDDLLVGSAQAHSQGLDQDLAFRRFGLGHIPELQRILHAGDDGQSFHGFLPRNALRSAASRPALVHDSRPVA